ncbi:MAG: hypothetical protein GX228_04580 [Firmicutes bacterium]|nr:right-handed parallel beta-helix repeat-containing protein [Bacillota bacterium]NLL88198.1 hypothetical protein [Bacillota bacterium]
MVTKKWFAVLLLVFVFASGWMFAGRVLAAPDQPIAPGWAAIVTPEHTANLEAAALEEKYANALKITAAELIELFDVDEDIIVKINDDGITFTSTVPGTTAGDKNRFVCLGYKDGWGVLDLTALDNMTGKIGVDLFADLDLTNTTNGFYVRLKRAGQDRGRYHRESAGVSLPDTVFPTYTTNAVDNAYLELTIPWQGSITVKSVFLWMESEIRGFADMAERINGGAGAAQDRVFHVANGAEFYNALQEVREKPAEPAVIYIDGTITFDEYWAAAGRQNARPSIELGSQVENLSIIGVGANGLFDGIGLKIQGRNTIVQNVTVRYVRRGDALEINNAKYVMIDHCTLYNEPLDVNKDKNKYDELISIKNDTEYVILSWNHIYNSHKTILIGSNDGEDAQPDRKVIMHHNLIENCNSRLPLFRGGHGHIYNNYYRNCDGSGINCRTGSKILIENNYFENVSGPIGFWFDDVNPGGLYELRGNIYDRCRGSQPTASTVRMNFEAGYSYSWDAVEDVPRIVAAGAGAGQI